MKSLNYPGFIEAIDCGTGTIQWKHDIGASGPGLLTTAGGLLFTGDNSGHFMTIDSSSGKTLWHTTTGANQNNGAITFEMDGEQYVVVGAGDSLFAFNASANAERHAYGEAVSTARRAYFVLKACAIWSSSVRIFVHC